MQGCHGIPHKKILMKAYNIAIDHVDLDVHGTASDAPGVASIVRINCAAPL